MRPKIIYCYDAYCGWCYGFSPVIKAIYLKYQHEFDFETLSGGMIPKESTKHIASLAGYIRGAYKTVENMTGVTFGEDYLWHIFNPDQSDWFPNSEMAAVAMAIFREIHPERSIEFASGLQEALYKEGRDLTDKEAYRQLVSTFNIDPEDFLSKLSSEDYKEKAQYDFSLIKQLKVNGFPTVFLQINESKLYMIAKGYSDLESVESRINKIMAENNVK